MTTADQPQAPSDGEHLDPQVETWWVGILNGTGSGRHPLQPRVQARLDGDTLIVSGAVGSEGERRDVERDARRCCADAIPHIEFDVKIRPESDGRRGLLQQVLWASFDNCEQATIAAQLLRERLPDAISQLAVLEQVSDVQGSCIPSQYADDVGRCLESGKAVLVIEADETDTFRVQELLDQDTRSLETTVFPPTAAAHDEAGSRNT